MHIKRSVPKESNHYERGLRNADMAGCSHQARPYWVQYCQHVRVFAPYGIEFLEHPGPSPAVDQRRFTAHSKVRLAPDQNGRKT